MSVSPRLRRFALPVLAVATLAVLVPPPEAGAVVSPKKCGRIIAKGESYAVRGHRVRCTFARRTSRRFLRHGLKPAGWSCRRYPRRVTRIAFTCRRGGKDVYAIRR